ncbi:MAG: AsmA family protein [Candidatus Korobacteraceae bacterium]
MIWAVVLVVVLALFLPPFINVNRYRNRAAGAIGRALGRDVTVSNLELKLLPRPGVVLYNFVVADDPSYGAEPMLRADNVTAYLRLSSLWRGRLEIGTLDLDNPSLNLVRRPDGHWNLEELVERASQTNPAPTAKVRPEARPRFPYVEASSGRINFKLGAVKKAFAFTDADFALWLESESLWGFRLKARPVRTDINISDTGTLKLDGRFQRASNLRDTPLYLKLSFSDGPLGQLTKLFYARDRGWRGDVRASAVLTGTPAALGVTADAQVDDFRRYDIALGQALRLRTHCTGTYSSTNDALFDVRCESPVGPGTLRVRGDAEGWGVGGYDWDISGEHIPADRAVAFARHAKKDLPADLTATGEVEATFSVRKSPGSTAQWSGGGQTTSFALQADVLKNPLQLGEVEFAVAPTAPNTPKKRAPHLSPTLTGAGKQTRLPRSVIPSEHRESRDLLSSKPLAGAGQLTQTTSGFQLIVKPFPISLGATSPATASASFGPEHYSFHLAGNAELGRLFNVAQALGVGTPGIGLAGTAQLDIEVAGPWMGFTPPAPSGKVQLRTATAELQGVSEPLQIDSASIVLENQQVKIASFIAAFKQGTHLSGSASFPVHCTGPENCVVNFDVRTDDASLARLNQLLNPSLHQPWYHLLAIGKRNEDALMKLRASGHFAAARFELGPIVANNVNGSLELSSGKLRIHELRGDFLGGHQDGSWLADFTVSPPRFMGNGVVSKVSMTQLATLMHDNWATGTVDAEYSLTLSGISAAKLRSSASGTADFNWTAGALRHLSLDSHSTPIAFSKFSGKIALQDGTFTLTDSKMQSGGSVYAVKGTASYDRSLSMKLERSGGQSYVISGTLDKPAVQAVNTPAAEASLR